MNKIAFLNPLRGYSEPCQSISKIEYFAKVFNGLYPFTIFTKRSVVYVNSVLNTPQPPSLFRFIQIFKCILE